MHSFRATSDGAPTLNYADQYYDHSNHEQEVDQRSTDMDAEAECPQYQQNYDNCPEHNAPVEKVAAAFGNKRASSERADA